MNELDRIWIDPERRSGKPCIRGTRIAVMDVFEYLAGGMTVAEVLDDFPSLTADDIRSCFAYAAIKTYRPITDDDYPPSRRPAAPLQIG